jgi:cytochrome c biogenesis protein CcmG, thiol:disulfide interchange protein DsbE
MRVHTVRKALVATVVVTAVGVLTATLWHGLYQQPDTPAGPPSLVTVERGQPAPPLSGKTLQGASFDLAALRGRVVLVNVWATWCEPCRTELPVVTAAARDWSAYGLMLVGLDVRDDPGQALALLAQLDPRSTMTVVPDPSGTAAVDWGVRGVPETFVIDRSGLVRVWAQGAVTPAWLEQWVRPLLTS